MTHQQILEAIRSTAKEINSAGWFVHGRNSTAANDSDKPYPRIHLLPFVQERDPSDTEKRTSNLFIQFHQKDEGEQDDTEGGKRETIVNEMEELMDSFLDQLTEDYENDIEFVTIRTEPQYQVFEGVSGFSLQLNIKTQVGC